MIEVRSLRFDYPHTGGSIEALTGITLSVEHGEFVALMGPNGSGKSTLALCLNGVLLPTAGSVRVDGEDSRDQGARWRIRQKVGLVFQNPDNQFITSTVEREIAFGLENLDVPSREIRDRVEEILAAFTLESYRHAAPHNLSGGEKQKVACAAVMAMAPSWIVLDEPASLLDRRGEAQVFEQIERLRDHGVGVILITQSVREALQADRLILLGDGRVAADRSPPSFEPGEGIESLPTVRLAGLLAQAGVPLGTPPLSPEGLVETLESIRESSSRGPRPLLRSPGFAADAGPDRDPALRRHAGPSAGKAGEITTVRARRKKTVIEVEDIDFSYQEGFRSERPALRDVALAVRAGDLFSLVGPTGSGKSTLALHFNALLMPNRGRVLVQGRPVNNGRRSLAGIRQLVGVALQYPEDQFFLDTVSDELAFGPRNFGLSEDELPDLLDGALTTVGLNPARFLTRSPFTLSYGEARRVAIAAVLAWKPEVLVLDEPTAGLDSHGIRSIVTLMRSLHRTGRTIVLISHDVDLALEECTCAGVLNEGHLLRSGPPQTIVADDLLPQAGLTLPEATRVMRLLRAHGWQVSGAAPSVAAAFAEIAGALG